MLEGAEKLFQSVRSIEYVCYRASEATGDELKRLLRELPGAGVALIELDALEACQLDPGECGDTGEYHAREKKYDQISPRSETTLLLAGSPETLALAKGTPMATVGYGQLAAGYGAEDADKVNDTRKTGGETAGGCKGANVGGMTDMRADIIVEGFEEVDVQFLDRIMKRAQGLPWITVVTERCFLREITLEDLDDLFTLYDQPGITDYTEPLYERQQEEQYTRDYIENMYRFYGYGMWLVCDRKSGALIGRAGFSHQDLGDEIVLEMGYIIGVPYQQQGYATEVCEKLIEFARTNLSDFQTINCFVEPGNTASHGLMKKLHFDRTEMVTIAGKTMVRYQKAL